MFTIIRNGYEAFCATIDKDNLVKVYSIRDEDDEVEEEQDHEQGEHVNDQEEEEEEEPYSQEVLSDADNVIEAPSSNWSEYKFDEERVGDLRMSVIATTIFKGHCTCEDFPERKHQNCCNEVWHNCNSLLLRLEDLSYILVCGDTGLLQFHTKNQEEILSFTSRMGPNGVCYPLATSANHFYILLEQKVVPLSIVDNTYKCPYDWYFTQEKKYRATINFSLQNSDDEQEEEDNHIGEKMENVRELLGQSSDDDE